MNSPLTARDDLSLHLITYDVTYNNTTAGGRPVGCPWAKLQLVSSLSLSGNERESPGTRTANRTKMNENKENVNIEA